MNISIAINFIGVIIVVYACGRGFLKRQRGTEETARTETELELVNNQETQGGNEQATGNVVPVHTGMDTTQDDVRDERNSIDIATEREPPALDITDINFNIKTYDDENANDEEIINEPPPVPETNPPKFDNYAPEIIDAPPAPLEIYPPYFKIKNYDKEEVANKPPQKKAPSSSKDPPLQISSPVRNYIYELGEDVVLTWIITDGDLIVSGFDIAVTHTTTTGETFTYHNPCKSRNVKNHCNMAWVTLGRYTWTLRVTTSKGKTITSQVVGSFVVVEAPVPELKPPVATYKHHQEIFVGWSIKDPHRIIKAHFKVMLWKHRTITPTTGTEYDGNGRPTYPPDESYDADCDHITNNECQYHLPKQDRKGSYLWNVEAESRKGRTRRGAHAGWFSVLPG